MPIAHVRGININYEVLGTGGPWVALSPGGRRALDNVKSLAQHVADAGYRVLIHDRRNCGLSDIAIGAELSEYEVWAEDLHELLSQLNALPAVFGGGSSGCRLSVLFALKYPHAVRALLLVVAIWFVLPTLASDEDVPNAALTPGDVFPNVSVDAICTPGYAGSVRHVTAIVRQQVFTAYGLTGNHTGYCDGPQGCERGGWANLNSPISGFLA